MNEGCMFCRDAGSDFDWCRICGRGQPEPHPPAPPVSRLREALEAARRPDPVAFIRAYNEMRQARLSEERTERTSRDT